MTGHLVTNASDVIKQTGQPGAHFININVIKIRAFERFIRGFCLGITYIIGVRVFIKL